MKLAAILCIVVILSTSARSDPPLDEEIAWGEAKGGLASRLTLVTKQPALGSPIKLKLEVKNVGDKPASYDSQQSATNASLIVTGPDGKTVPYVAGSYQTMGRSTTLKPGESKTIFADIDMCEQYLIDRPGSYTLQTQSRGGIPASNKLPVTVGNGKLGDFQTLFGEVHRAAPKGWRAANSQGSIVFLSSPTGLKADATSVSLMFTKDNANPVKPRDAQPLAVELGETTLGFAWLSAESKTAVERWPEYAEAIGERLKAFKK